MNADEVEFEFADVLLLRPFKGALCPDVQQTGYHPANQFIQEDARQEEGVVQRGGGLEALGEQPPQFEDVLVEPPLQLPEQIE